MAGFNMWDYELTVDQMNLLTCESEGNLVSSAQLQLGGEATYSYENFECGECWLMTSTSVLQVNNYA